jgi:D-amino-acid oxidase
MDIGRRDFFAGAAAAFATGWATPALAQPDGQPKLLEPPPLPSEAERLVIKRGYRPVRKKGPRLEIEPKDVSSDKLPRNVLHNYGHGGGGITLSWGYAKAAADLLFSRRDLIRGNEVVILGAGIIGLTTAHAILTRFAGSNPPLRISLYARDTPDGHGAYGDIVSSIAGGQFAPSLTGEIESRDLRAKLTESARVFQAHEAWGVSRRRNYTLADAPDLRHVDLIVGRGRGGPVEQRRLPFRSLNCAGYGFETLLIEPPRYLRALWQDLRNSSTFRSDKAVIASPRDLNAFPDTLIVNCMGLGAKSIVSEAGSEFYGSEGQIIQHRPANYQPSLYPYLYSGIGYVFPRSDYVVIGGSVDGPGRGENDRRPVTQEYGHAIVRVHRQVFSGRVPLDGFPPAFSGRSRGRAARCAP